MIVIQTFVCNSFWENTYLVYDSGSKEAALIDPGCSNEAEWGAVRDFIAWEKVRMKFVLLTHGHVDHIMGSEWPVKEYGVDVCGSLDEMYRLPSAEIQARMFGLNLSVYPASVTHDLKEGDSLMLGFCRLDVIDVSVHSPHCLCFQLVVA